MSNERAIIVSSVAIVLVVGTVLLLSLSYYLRLPPHPQLQFISNRGWALQGGCGPTTIVLGNGQYQEGHQCAWKLSTDSYFEPTGDTTRVVQWCQQHMESTKSDVYSPYFRFNYSHAIPMWSDTCRQEVVIQTSVNFQIILR